MLPYLDIHTHRPSGDSNVRSIQSIFASDYGKGSETDSLEWISVGIHPWNIGKTPLPGAIQRLESALSDPALVAIGEAGLDRTIEADMEVQIEVLSRQDELAWRSGLPMVIHCVKAHTELITHYRNSASDIPYMLHGFRGGWEQAGQLIEEGFYLSFGESILHVEKHAEALARTPMEQLFLETDESKTDIASIYQRAASLKSIPVYTLKEKIWENAEAVFTCIKR